LDRSQATEDVENPNDENATFLRSFNKARIWDVSKNNISPEQLEALQTDDYWRNLLQDRYLQMLAEEETVFTHNVTYKDTYNNSHKALAREYVNK
jgi:hypothetical protein